MLDLPVQADVYCSDGKVGSSTALIINPVSNKVTHIVVQDRSGPLATERLVPVELILETSTDQITLNCTIEELNELEQFSEVQYVQNEYATMEYMEPYMTPLDMNYIESVTEHIPAGELAVRRGAQVEATDGHIGSVGEFLVHPESGAISHVVLEKGHLWGRKEMHLPVSIIDRVDGFTVYLKLSKAELDALPVIPVHREWESAKDVELVIYSFEGAETAEEVYESLRDLAQDKKIGILNSAVLSRDADGKTHLKEKDDLGAGRGALFGAVTGGIIGLLGGPVGVIIGAAAGAAAGGAAAHYVDVGFDDHNLKALRDNLQENSSAIVVLLESASAEQAIAVMSELGGHQVQQSISDEQVARIIAARQAAAGQDEEE